ncbi:tyrosine-type recombinase/integrase, partial [Streptomyces aureocirculatus]|uniref:tyrosine-type recombinase/integrase n=1 Tax=Streptomyces aureocirculatus TaxID=67275 RepID=UPI000563EC6F
ATRPTICSANGSQTTHLLNRTQAHPHTASADTRHTYVTHLIEDGADPKFVQDQVGHRVASTTAIYTGVSTDFTNTMMRKALDRAFQADGQEKV